MAPSAHRDRSLRAHGFDMAAGPESFLVTKENQLDPRETDRARAWGRMLAAGLAANQPQGPRG
jgi:hypothetical protein